MFFASKIPTRLKLTSATKTATATDSTKSQSSNRHVVTLGHNCGAAGSVLQVQQNSGLQSKVLEVGPGLSSGCHILVTRSPLPDVFLKNSSRSEVQTGLSLYFAGPSYSVIDFTQRDTSVPTLHNFATLPGLKKKDGFSSARVSWQRSV